MRIKQSLESIVFKFNTVSMRIKIVGLVVVCILFASAALVWYTDRDAKMALEKESQSAGTSLAGVLASQSLDLINRGDVSTLGSLVKGYVDTSANIYYIRIVDPVGISAAQDSKAPDINYQSISNHPNSSTTPSFQSIQFNGQVLTDIALALPGFEGGEVHVGVTTSGVMHTVAMHIHHILLWLILVMGMAVTLAYFLSYALTYPMSLLAEEARELGRGSYKQHNQRWGKDEIGALGRAFDQMSLEISQKEQMRNQLLAQVLTAQEDERKRIARELHDDTSQSLTSLMVELKAAEHAGNLADIKPRLNELRNLAYQTLQGVHNMAMELRPNALDDLGLVAAVTKYAADFQAKNGIQVDLQVSVAAKRRFPTDVETAAYRIVQEALANVVRHSGATAVSVVIDFQESVFKLIVEDNGKGFDPDEASRRSPEHRLGLFGMYERASLVGGNLVVESQPGQGSSVFLAVPIKSNGGGSWTK